MLPSRASDEQTSTQEQIEGNTNCDHSNTRNRAPVQPSTVYILFVGRYGCGKSDLIKSWQDSINSSRDIKFELISASSFDHPDRPELDTHIKIADQVIDQEANGQPISGIIYCHPVGDTITSGGTQRNMRALIELFLGKQGLNRLTILVLPTTTSTKVERVATKIKDKKSLAFNEAFAGGAKVVAVKQTDDVINDLHRFSRMTPLSPPVCQAIPNRLSAREYVENALGYFGRRSMESLNQKSIDVKQALEAEIAHYQAEHRALHDRLRQTEREYASLRSQVQLQNGYEQAEIIQDLDKINDMIERFGQTVSEHLVDTYVQHAFNKSPIEVTVSDARDLSHLKLWLQGYREQMLLLPDLETLGGDTSKLLNVDNFLQFFLRARLCNILHEKMFKPFHPFIEPTESLKLDEYYAEVQKQEHQYTGGRWRSITFQMLCTRLNLRRTSKEYIGAWMQEFTKDFLKHLAKYFFGLSEIFLEESHYNDLHQIAQAAWEWNRRIKTEVIMLGDFYPTASIPGPFDDISMVEFEADSCTPCSKFALCTLGLGLISRQAKGGGAEPDQVVLLKTKVLTDVYYDST